MQIVLNMFKIPQRMAPSGAQSRKVVQLEKVKIVIIDLKWIMHKPNI